MKTILAPVFFVAFAIGFFVLLLTSKVLAATGIKRWSRDAQDQAFIDEAQWRHHSRAATSK